MDDSGRNDIEALLDELAGELRSRGIRAAIYVVGGAAIALREVSESRRTADVDAVMVPEREVRDAAHAVAKKRGLRQDWLNSSVRPYVPRVPRIEPPTDPGLRVVLAEDDLTMAVPVPTRVEFLQTSKGAVMGNPIVGMVRRGWLVPMVVLGRLGTSYYRVVFRGAGLRSGLLAELAQHPARPDELVVRLGLDPSMTDGLASWFDAGVALKELRVDEGRYAIRSRSLRKLLDDRLDPVAAFTEEMASLHHRLLWETPDRLRTAERLTIAEADPATIARSSRLGEPWITAALERHVPRTGPVRLLEVGCGSGAHIRTAARLNPSLTATGLELQDDAADLARRNISDWGLRDRVEVASGDIRDRTPDASADLVTLHQNIYYFPEDGQVELFRHLAGFLAPGGTLLVTTIVRDAGVGSITLDLWGAMTEGTSRLPVPDELVGRMREAGLSDARYEWLGRDKLYCAFVATRS